MGMMAGGLPIFKDGVCVGAVGVSGVKPVFGSQVSKAAVDALAGGRTALSSELSLDDFSNGQEFAGAQMLATTQVWMIAAGACTAVAALFFYLGRWQARGRQRRDALIS